jgi:hypothetical protein
MRPGSHDRIPTVSEVIREATAICDRDGTETAVSALYDAFEDDDRPATAAQDLRRELLGTVRGIDPEEDEPAAWAAAAAAVWLANHPAQNQGDQVIREGVRRVFNGQPPELLADWLEARGIQV